MCNGKHYHATVDGAVCAKADTYDPLLGELWALTIRNAYNQEDINLAFEDLNACPPNAAGVFENLAVNELLRSASWTVRSVSKVGPGQARRAYAERLLFHNFQIFGQA